MFVEAGPLPLLYSGEWRPNNAMEGSMNFEFGEDRVASERRGFLAEHCPPAAVRAVLDGDVDHDAELWQKIVEMGWTATVIRRVRWLGPVLPRTGRHR